jgi:hypothetical protein
MMLLEKLDGVSLTVSKPDKIGARAMSSSLLHRSFWKHEQNLKKRRKLTQKGHGKNFVPRIYSTLLNALYIKLRVVILVFLGGSTTWPSL